MYDKLENLLNQWVSPERRESIMSALRVMEAYGAMSAWSEISAMLEYATDESVSMILDGIEGILHIGLDRVLVAHTIMMDATIPTKTTVLEGIQILQNYDDHEQVLRVSENSSDSIQTLADLLELATTQSWAQFVDHIVSVSPTLIEAISKMHETEEPEDADPTFASADVEKAQRMARYVTAYPNCLARAALTDQMRPLGTPMSILMADYKLELGILEPRAAEQAAIELVGLALLGDVPYKDFTRRTKDLSDVMYSDLNFITQVDLVMDRLFAEIMQSEQRSSADQTANQ